MSSWRVFSAQFEASGESVCLSFITKVLSVQAGFYYVLDIVSGVQDELLSSTDV